MQRRKNTSAAWGKRNGGKTKVYKTSNGTRVIMTTVSNNNGTAWVEKRYNKKTKNGVVSVVSNTRYDSNRKTKKRR